MSRRLKAFSHDARLMPANYVRATRNDYRDAEAIAEAVQRPTMRSVAPSPPINSTCKPYTGCAPVSSANAQRSSTRSAPSYSTAASLGAQGLHRLRLALPDILATRTDLLAPRLLHILEDLIGDWQHLDQRIDTVSLEVKLLAQEDLPVSA